jgi:hypothetical protein
MNPDRLFDYLDGKLSESERAELEELLVSDPKLRRELGVARQIHSEMRNSREVLAATDEKLMNERGAVLGRRIAIAFAVLVFANVLFGIYAIVFMEKKQRAKRSEEQNRTELTQTLQRAAVSALPTPSLDVEEIKFTAPVPKQDSLANMAITAAEQCGGSGTKGLADAHGILVFAEVPPDRLADLRERLKKMGATVPSATGQTPQGNKAIVQIRISEPANP